MGHRSDRFVVGQPFPVVFDGFVAALPHARFRVHGADRATGRIECDTRRNRLTISIGAIDAITTEWVVDIEQKIGLRKPRHDTTVMRVRRTIDDYLVTYYET